MVCKKRKKERLEEFQLIVISLFMKHAKFILMYLQTTNAKLLYASLASRLIAMGQKLTGFVFWNIFPPKVPGFDPV